MSELLPAPEGAVTTNSLPARVVMRSFDVLHLLAHLLDQQLQLKRAVRDPAARRLGSERVGLAVELLGEEVEPFSGGAAFVQSALDLAEMRTEPLQLLVDVDFRGEERDFRADPFVVGGA